MKPTFSVVVTDFEGSVPRALLRRKLHCLADQTCQDFEAVIYHDGPKITSYAEDSRGIDLPPNIRFVVTERRANDWGHSNRDRGIREASGDWIIHTNADNVFYPNLIARLKLALDTPSVALRGRPYPLLVKSLAKRWDKVFGTGLVAARYTVTEEKQILIYAVLMRGLLPMGRGQYRRMPELADRAAIVFGGVPVKRGCIDAMQFVMRRDLWLRHGGWYDRTEEGDGKMFVEFANLYAITAVPEVLGEHW